MELVKQEFSRNLSGYFLVMVSLVCVCISGFLPAVAQTAAIDLAKGLGSAALLAFQIKKAPDGNTTTATITTPPDEPAPDPVLPQPK